MYGQDENLFNHYFVNQGFFNPSYSGFSGKHSLQMALRSQWSGFPGAPNTYAANYNGPVSQNIGLGVTLFSENIASFNRYRAGLNYSFRFEQGDLKASLGISTNLEYYRISDPTTGNSLYDNNDRTISDFSGGETFFDAGLGIYLSYFNYYLGLTSPNLIQSRIDDISLDMEDNTSVFRHYTAMMGAFYEFGSTGVSLEPTLFFRKARNVPMEFSSTVLLGYLEEKIKAGFSYYSAYDGSVSLVAGSKLSNFHIFYSYNLSFGKFQQYGTGTHEITVGINFDSRISRFRNAF
jgi:type IX secretion system PorP/SprF family membrane protein